MTYDTQKPGGLISGHIHSRDRTPFSILNAVFLFTPRNDIAHGAVARSGNPRANRGLGCTVGLFKSSDSRTATDGCPAISLEK